MNHVESFLERPRLYYNIDGVGELGLGFFALSCSLLGWLQVLTPKDAIWHQMYVFVLYFAIVFLIVHYGSKAIKRHITYPRTGFVEYRAHDTRWHAMMFGSACAVSVSLLIGLRWHPDLTTLVFGLFFAVGYARGVARTARWKWIVVWAMAFSSLIIAILPGDLIGALASRFWLSMTLYGAMLLISGGGTFWLYLRHTQPPAQEGQ